MQHSRIGRPRGVPTVFWTKAEIEVVRDAIEDIAKKLPRRTVHAIIKMMLRIESENEYE